jgi:hypothetical protein
MNIPDVVGFLEEEGIRELTNKGFHIANRVVLKPMKAVEPVGSSRIICIKILQKEQLEILVAHKDYLKGGVY